MSSAQQVLSEATKEHTRAHRARSEAVLSGRALGTIGIWVKAADEAYAAALEAVGLSVPHGLATGTR